MTLILSIFASLSLGSHICVELLEAGYNVIVVDNLINSSKEAVRRVEELTGRKITLYVEDICNKDALDTIFSRHKIYAVLHLAALKAVGESVDLPLRYYDNNLVSTINLLDLMQKHGVENLVFSSSATVYGGMYD